jgi:hypothetical protein
MNTESMVNNVMARIAKRRVVRARSWATLHGVISLGALCALIPAYQYLAGSAAASGFSAYFSLLASDGASLAHSWQAFLMSLVESAPITGTIMVLGLLVVLAYAARKTAVDLGQLRLGGRMPTSALCA